MTGLPTVRARQTAGRILQAASALTLADTALTHWHIRSGDAVAVPWIHGLGLDLRLMIPAYAAWAIGTAVIETSWELPLGWLAPVGATVVLALDQQTSNTYGLLVVLFTAVMWWSARLRAAGHADWNVPLLAIMAQISIVFAWTMFGKLQGTFLSGHLLALSWTGPLAGLVTFPIGVFRAMAVVTVLFETFVAVGVWLPGVRKAAVASAGAFHLTTLAFLTPTLGLAAFTAAMATGYALILGPKTGER